MRIGVLGGSFDPIHRTHIAVAQAAARQLRLDRLLIIPTNASPHKQVSTSPKHRLCMARLAVRELEKIRVSDIEIRRGGISYTIDTLKALRARYPRAELYLIIGADMVEILPKWRAFHEIAHLATFAVVMRPGYRLKTPSAGIYVPIRFRPRACSSTEIRRVQAAGRSINRLVPPAVAQYISRKGLYSEKPA